MPNKDHFLLPFGFKVQRQADWVAVLALTITLLLAWIQIREAFLLTSEVKLLDAQSVTVFEFKCGKAKPHIELAIPIGLANVGAIYHDAIVTDVRVTLLSGKKAIEFGPGSTAMFPSSERAVDEYLAKTHACTAGRASLKRFELVQTPQVGAVPLNVKAGSATMHLIWFIPTLKRESRGQLSEEQPNRMNAIQFLNWAGNEQQLFIEIEVDIFEQEPVGKRCSFAFTALERSIFSDLKWIRPETGPCEVM